MSDALKRLIEAVEAGEESDATFFARMMARQARDFGTYWPSMDVQKAYGGDLNAAKALHDALLPGWTVNTFNQCRHPDNGMMPTGEWDVLLFAALPDRFAHSSAKASDPARAWLLAILRAYQQVQA